MQTRVTSSKPLLAIVASALLGVLYFLYISKVSFPHNSVRIIPLIWLALALYGLTTYLSQAQQPAWYSRALVIIIAAINILFALIFALGALIGD